MSVFLFRALRHAVGAMLLASTAIVAHAQGFPSKPVTLLVPYPAGGPADMLSRQIQPDFAKFLGQPVIVDNLGGGSGSIGVQKVLNTAADGHMVLVGNPSETILAPLSLAAIRYKPEDLRLVGLLASTSMVLVTRPDFPAKTVDEFIEYLRNPANKPVSYGSIGPGSLYQLVAESFRLRTGTRMTHIPYRGGAPLIQDLMSGQIDVAFIPFAGGNPALIETGKIRMIGSASLEREARIKGPTLNEGKYLKNFSYQIWAGLLVSKATPDEVVTRLSAALADAVKNPATRKSFEDQGNIIPAAMGLADSARFYGREIQQYREIAKAINLEPQ